MLAADQLPEDVFGAPVIHPELAIQAYTIGLFPMSDDRDDSNALLTRSSAGFAA